MKTAEPPTKPASLQTDGIPLPLPARPNAHERIVEAQKKKAFFRRPGVIVVGLVLAILGVIYAAGILLHALTHESTDDAFIDSHVVSIAPKIAGKVRAVYAKDNQFVKKGEPLFEIDPSDYQAVLEQREAALQVALAKRDSADAAVRQAEAHMKTLALAVDVMKANVDGAQAEATLAQADYQRSKSLSGGGAISQQDFEHSLTGSVSAHASLVSKAKEMDAAVAYGAEAKTQAESAAAQAVAARAAVQEAKAEVAQAELQLSYTKPVAPEDGRVTSKAVEAGDYVQVGQTLLAIVPSEVWVTANFKETQITDMRPGGPAKIEVDAYPGHAFAGHVDSIQAGSGARFSLLPPENATGNFVKVVQRVPVKIVFDEKLDPQHALGPGMSAVPDVTVRDGALRLVFIAVLAGVLILALTVAALFWMGKARHG